MIVNSSPTAPDALTAAPIVVATDGSDESLHAARWANNLAGRLGAPIHVLDVLHQPSVEAAPEDFEEFEKEAEGALQARLRSAGITTGAQRAVIGDVVDVLARASRNAELLVLGSAERAGWGRHGHFSLVHTLAHRVDCPLAVVPAGPWTDRSPVLVVGVDGSEASYHTLSWARDLAHRSSMHAVGAFVVDPMYTTFTPPRDWLGSDEHEARTESREESVEMIERFGADPAITLEAIAADRNASILVVGAKDRHSIGGTLLGAIPTEILHHPTCPIIVVPHSMTAHRTHQIHKASVSL